MSKFVVAGVTGHVGSVVARDLLAAGDTVTVIVRDAKKGTEWSARGAKVAVGSLDDAEFVASAVKGADGFFTLIPPHYATGDIYSAQRKSADALAAGIKQGRRAAGGAALVGRRRPRRQERPDQGAPLRGEQVPRDGHQVDRACGAGSFQENAPARSRRRSRRGSIPNFVPSADIPVAQVATQDVGHAAAKLLKSPPARSEVVDLVGPAYSSRQLAEKLGKLLGKTLNDRRHPAPRATSRR